MERNFYNTAEWKELRRQVIERDGGRCRYCIYKRAITADHVTPRKRGGPDTLENLVACCAPCNGWFNGDFYTSFEDKKAAFDAKFLAGPKRLKELKQEYEQEFGRWPNQEESVALRRTVVAEGFEFTQPKFELSGAERCKLCHTYNSQYKFSYCESCWFEVVVK